MINSLPNWPRTSTWIYCVLFYLFNVMHDVVLEIVEIVKSHVHICWGNKTKIANLKYSTTLYLLASAQINKRVLCWILDSSTTSLHEMDQSNDSIITDPFYFMIFWDTIDLENHTPHRCYFYASVEHCSSNGRTDQ